ncbi:GvpL/GvpF family gas vesicle protein [Oculatella sp. LEGE 06141]|uniref:GvpL/GvpF family gas vesicle protein n=1 Tax=Oculatella sp. LEGE 06141 TaxID=1828648 RepID=UPI00187FC1FD|nr:GvpL/GvpF family gas vesicle protein [Oculatella sp. LEGE 06141]MBE9177276.1 GvpL/GvpF family gas vesicle protein [Oculatella sp. LEGE 06141]
MYTYAFLETPKNPIDLPCGIVGSLELVETARLAALVEPDLALENVHSSDRQLLQAALDHDRVIREIFEQTAVLPLQFGNFIQREDLVNHLKSRSTEYLEKLTHLRDKAEYTLKLTPRAIASEPQIPSEVTGKAYFLAKKQHYQHQVEQQQQQQQELEDLLAAIAKLFPNSIRSAAQDGVERIYLLGNRQDDALLHAQLQGWQSQCPHWEVTLGDALPPYHFV